VIDSVSFPALGTTAIVCVAEADGLEPARAAVAQELEAIDRACSRFRADSELSRLNAAQGARTLVGPLLLEALQVAVRAAAVTDGLVDPTIGRTLRESGYDRTFTLVRAGRGHVRFASVPGWKTIELDEERRTARIPPGAELDLGATAKALAADRAARAAAAAAGCGVLVGLGGDIAVAGDPPPGDGRSASPTTTPPRWTRKAPSSRSTGADWRARARASGGGARPGSSCTTSSTREPHVRR
jgi:thiamine biosynthesis lipoprotein